MPVLSIVGRSGVVLLYSLRLKITRLRLVIEIVLTFRKVR